MTAHRFCHRHQFPWILPTKALATGSHAHDKQLCVTSIHFKYYSPEVVYKSDSKNSKQLIRVDISGQIYVSVSWRFSSSERIYSLRDCIDDSNVDNAQTISECLIVSGLRRPPYVLCVLGRTSLTFSFAFKIYFSETKNGPNNYSFMSHGTCTLPIEVNGWLLHVAFYSTVS